MNAIITSEEIKKIVNFRSAVCRVNLFLSVLLYAVVLLGFEKQWGLMLIYGLWITTLYVMLIISELRFRGLGLLTLFFVGALTRHAVPIIDHAIGAMGGVKYAYFYDYTNYMFPAAIAMGIYYMVFVLGMTHFSRDKMMSIDMSPILKIRHFNKIVVFAYFIGLFFQLFPGWFSVLGWMGMIFNSLCDISLLAMAFYCSYKDDKWSKVLFYIFIISNILVAIFVGFYKGAIMLPLIIYILYFILSKRVRGEKLVTFKTVSLAIVAVFFLLFFIYPFMSLKRTVSGWNPTDGVTVDFSTTELVMEVLTNSSSEVGGNSGEQFSSRLNSLDCNAYFYMFANEHGYHQDVLISCFRMFYPKWLGRDVENDVMLNPGYMLCSYMDSGHVLRNPILSAGNAGRFGAAYFWGGWPAALFMCLFNAVVISFLFSESKKKIKNIFALLIFLQIVMQSIVCYEESTHSGGFKTAIMWMLLYTLLVLTSNMNIQFKK